MPTYEYRCPNGHTYSEIRHMDEPQRVTTCPNLDCGLYLTRVFSPAPIQFKGSGFYSNRG